jgi:hypothetical protein
MSISVLESLQSRRMLAEIDSMSDDLARISAGVAEEIEDGFSLLGTMKSERIALPNTYTDSRGALRAGEQTMVQAVRELTAEDSIHEWLMKALEESDCPHVAALRDALCMEYKRLHVHDVAEARL